MQALILTTIFAVTFVNFLTNGNKAMQTSGWLPDGTELLPEILTIFTLIYVIALGVKTRFQFVQGSYWLAFGALGICIICGLTLNLVEPGPIIAGMRQYFRALPMFFLPAVYLFSNEQIRQQLFWLMIVGFIQIPLAIHQRLETGRIGSVTGDWTSGTLMISSILSIFLISAVCVLTALYLRKALSFSRFMTLTVLLLIPTTVNETKGTLLLLPIAMVAVFLAGSPAGARLKNLVVSIAVLAVFAPLFIVVYDSMVEDHRNPVTISEFFSESGKFEEHIYKGDGLDTTRMIGRVDAVVVPFKELSADPANLIFGLGIGNASDSSLGRGFSGHYSGTWGVFTIHSFSMILLELGLMGVGLVCILYWLILRDSWIVSNSSKGVKSNLALAWIGVTILITLASFYKNLIYFESLSYLFWFYSGLIAAERMRIADAAGTR